VVRYDSGMRQVELAEHGPPEVLYVETVPDPVAGPGQVLIRVEAAGVTFVETQVRAGRSPRPQPDPAVLPAVLGNGVEGTIVDVGPEIDAAMVGRRVVTTTGGLGGYAEMVVVGAAEPIAVPEALAPGEAVALLADGRTALALARAAAVQTGDRVAVTAAAGGVGGLLVQLARAAGAASVVGLVGSEPKRATTRELGADHAIVYGSDDWPDAVRAAVGELDVVFDGVGAAVGRTLLDLVAPGARYVIFGAAGGSMTDPAAAAARGLTVIPLSSVTTGPDDLRALSEQALAEAAAGRLRPTIGQRFPLAAAAEAHAAIESRATIGKTLLIP
jgi:NADPH2:quinone reductase